MTVVVTMAALSLHLHYRPYAAPKLQVLETMSLSVSLLTFVLAQLLLASGNEGSDSPVAELVVAIVIIAANAAFLCMFFVLLRGEMARKVRPGGVLCFAPAPTYARVASALGTFCRAQCL